MAYKRIYNAMKGGTYGWFLELGTCIRLTERPTSRGGIIRDNSAAVAGGDLKREALPVKIAVTLPILSPIS